MQYRTLSIGLGIWIWFLLFSCEQEGANFSDSRNGIAEAGVPSNSTVFPADSSASPAENSTNVDTSSSTDANASIGVVDSSDDSVVISPLDAFVGFGDGNYLEPDGQITDSATTDAADASDGSTVADSSNTDSGEPNSECPHSGNIRYTINRSQRPSTEESKAYELLTAAMDEAIRYYNCYTDLDKELWVNYKPGVPTAEANIDGWMSFGANRGYMVVATAMHEIAHTLGIGYYNFREMTDRNGIWTGANANAVLASIPNPRDTQLHADDMHFWPYGLNYASEHENEDDLINHCRIVAAIRLDMGL